MLIDAATSAALERIAQRGEDVMRAYAPGAVPFFDDVASAAASRPSLDPLSVAAPDDAYFITGGAGERHYTRDGSFSLREDVLVTAGGRPVLGYASDTGPLVALRANDVDVALGRVRDPHVEADGTFVYTRDAIDPRTGARRVQRVAAGRVALARFPAATRLRPVDAVSLSAPAGVQPHVGRPNDATFGKVEPMRREQSRVDIDAGLTHLEDAYLAFDAMQAARHAQGSMSKATMDLLK